MPKITENNNEIINYTDFENMNNFKENIVLNFFYKKLFIK